MCIQIEDNPEIAKHVVGTNIHYALYSIHFNNISVDGVTNVIGMKILINGS
jgi:hypothetical protein